MDCCRLCSCTACAFSWAVSVCNRCMLAWACLLLSPVGGIFGTFWSIWAQITMKRPPKARQQAQKNRPNCTKRTGHMFWNNWKHDAKLTKNGLINKGGRFTPPFCRPFFVFFASFFNFSQKNVSCPVCTVQICAIDGMLWFILGPIPVTIFNRKS